jgi:hypothetical protein
MTPLSATVTVDILPLYMRLVRVLYPPVYCSGCQIDVYTNPAARWAIPPQTPTILRVCCDCAEQFEHYLLIRALMEDARLAVGAPPNVSLWL